MVSAPTSTMVSGCVLCPQEGIGQYEFSSHSYHLSSMPISMNIICIYIYINDIIIPRSYSTKWQFYSNPITFRHPLLETVVCHPLSWSPARSHRWLRIVLALPRSSPSRVLGRSQKKRWMNIRTNCYDLIIDVPDSLLNSFVV